MSLSTSGGGCLNLGVEGTKVPGKFESPKPTFCRSDLGAGWELGNHRHTFLPPPGVTYQLVVISQPSSAGYSGQWET